MRPRSGRTGSASLPSRSSGRRSVAALAERLAVRQARGRPLVADLFSWLDAQFGRLPRSSPTAEAIR
jgi:hypothetical protein